MDWLRDIGEGDCMGNSKIVSGLLIVLALIVVIGASYLVISYATDILSAIVNFVTTNDFTKLRQSGVNVPEQFNKVKTDLTTVILPFLYIGMPLLLILIGVIMFFAGMHYNQGKLQEEVEKRETMEKEMMDRLAKKMNNAASQSLRPQPKKDESEEEEERPRPMPRK